MDITKLILQKLSKTGEVRVADIVKSTRFSRAYVNRFFQDLQRKGKIVLVGKANAARYIPATKEAIRKTKEKVLVFRRILNNKGLAEDEVLNDIKSTTGILLQLPQNVVRIVEYSFVEMLNNAIEHSRSKTIEVWMKRYPDSVDFIVSDGGIGIFSNIMKKRKLQNELEAIQDLLKGKQTTAPKEHTGEGIFFTSKAADILFIQSSKKRLEFRTLLDDVFVKDTPYEKNGTKVTFSIDSHSKRKLEEVFREHTDGSFDFQKTKVIVRLYSIDTDHISRSQARRILSGLESFKTIVLDFKAVHTVGQAFTDEVFRVWKGRYPRITIQYQNANENVLFMIKRVLPPAKLK